MFFCSCQTYEGGFSGCPGMEAHGGYAFCGISALTILGKGHLCDLQALLVIISINFCIWNVIFYF